jgi:TPR repeat protein
VPETECEHSQIVALSFDAHSSRLVRWSVELAGKQGDRPSQVVLGMLLGDEGLHWLERAAHQGSLVAVKQLHIHFASKAVLTKDSEVRTTSQQLAARWAMEGAKLDDLGLQRALGDYLFEGRGIPRDDAAAVYWWKEAAEKGSSFAQNSLSKALFEGRGTKRDHVQALKWAILAGQKIKGPGFGRLQVFHLPGLRAGMSETEISRAETNAQGWLLQHEERQTIKHNANEHECGIREFDKGAVR